MLRVYFDSNIFRALKQGNQFNKNLFEATNNLKGKLVYCFSDAHLDDLKDSPEQYRRTDLLIMENYVQDNYFSYNAVSKHFECLLATPQQAFKSKDYEAYDNAIKNPFDLDAIFKDIDESPELDKIKNLLNLYFDMPIGVFNDFTMEISQLDEKNKAWVDKIIPGYDPLMSLRDLMNNISPYSTSLLKDERQVTELRRYIREYMDREAYSFERWGNRFNEKFKETSVGKSFTDMIDSLLPENEKNNFNVKFSHAYTLLELYNITQERTSKGLKKFNLASLSTDASHAYFGSFCDYIVSNDKGMQVKANIVYQLYGIPTRVLSPEDFINLSSQLLRQEETYVTFLKGFEFDLKHSFLEKQHTDIESGIHTSNFKMSHTYFNYFNRLQIIRAGTQPIYAFYCDRYFYSNFFMFREIEVLVKKVNSVLGLDDDLKGDYRWEENNKWEVGETIRRWRKDKLIFSFTTSTKKFGNFIVLMIEQQNNT